jgi:ADP-ribose pyrophosphatase YjhB (NUDIX family)
MEPKWLEWAKALQALSQTGLHFTENVYDRDRYEQIRDIAIEMMAAQSGADPAYLRTLFDGQTGYTTPKVDVRGVVFKEDAMLLVREKMDEGRWTLPGGWADVNDTPSSAVEREIYEETGYRARAAKVLAVYDRSRQGHDPYPFHVYKLYFLCELLDDSPDAAKHDHETGEATFFCQEELPSDLSTGRITAAQLNRFFEHYRNPDLPTDFD